MKTQVHEYDGGGTQSRGYLTLPDKTGKRPGILVVHEAPGLDDHAKRRAEMLAGLGYVALAADLYGGGIVGKGEKALELMAPLRDNPDVLRRRMRAAFDELAKVASVDDKRLAAIGYCFGGMSVLELARSGAPAAGVVSFHGLLKTRSGLQRPARSRQKSSCVPARPSDRSRGAGRRIETEMIKAGTDWQVITYGGAKHAFTNTAADSLPMPGFGYSPSADARSWLAMQNFFAEIFGSD